MVEAGDGGVEAALHLLVERLRRGQLALLGVTFVLIALTTDLIWAVVAGTAGAVLKRSRTFLRIQRYVSGTIFIGLGALAAATGRSHGG